MSDGRGTRLTEERARQIAEECYPEVLAYCRRHAPRGHDAADLAQDVFLRFASSGSYRERGKPIAYLMRIARNVCIDASRARRLETVPLDFDAAQPEAPDLGWDVGSALAALPDDLREVVELRFSADLGIGEVASALGISRFAVNRRLKRALAMLASSFRAQRGISGDSGGAGSSPRPE